MCELRNLKLAKRFKRTNALWKTKAMYVDVEKDFRKFEASLDRSVIKWMFCKRFS